LTEKANRDTHDHDGREMTPSTHGQTGREMNSRPYADRIGFCGVGRKR
jgi:hypothetical protein